MKNLLPFLLLLSACSTAPQFRKAKSADDEGYTVTESDLKMVFDVTARLPKGTDQRTRDDYLIRAAGEECLKLGFLFWDIGRLHANSLRAFCLPQNKKTSIGVMMDQKAAADPKKPSLKVEDIIMNSYSPLRPHDVVRKIGGKEVETIGELKDQIFRLAGDRRKTVTVLVERSGIAISLEAPFSEQKDGVFTPEMLEGVRNLVP